jgi:TetR/AcrR family transcriptional repressor of nem operon
VARTSTKHNTRERLLDQGVALLMEQGYHGTGLQDVLQSVGVPKGSFYNYFGSKEAFGAEVIGHYIQPFIRQLDGWLTRPKLDALSALMAYFQEMIEELERRQYAGGCLLGNLIGEIGDTSGICRAALRSATREYRDKLRSGLAKAQQEGTIRTDKSAEEMADLLVNAWQGALLRMKIEQSTRPLEECCRNLLQEYFRP